MTPTGDVAPVSFATVVTNLTQACASGGLDLLQPLQADWYNSAVHDAHRIADFGNPGSLVVLIGNTRRLWPALVAALRRRSDLLEHSNPLDAYVEETITTAVNSLPLDSRIRWAHRPAPEHIAIQQMAEIAGLAWRSPASLSIHPVYGPWIGLRAAVVFPVPGPAERPLPAPVCEACPGACIKIINDASADRNGWQHQLAVRDACPIGRQYRYPELQIAYHYSKSPEYLRQAIDGASGNGGSGFSRDSCGPDSRG